MDRDGYYAVYLGKEYQLIIRSIDEHTASYELLSFASKDTKNGFVAEPRGKFRKKITLDQLETAYSVSTMCKYKGYEFQITLHHEEDDTYEIVYISKAPPIPVEQLGFTFAERGVYRKRVTKVELDSIYEVKTPILGFK